MGKVARTRVEFVGGPLCGKRQRVPKMLLAEYLVFAFGTRQYLYAFALRVGIEPVSAANRYVFLGHEAELPDDVTELEEGQ
jgi:hypothetical protein